MTALRALGVALAAGTMALAAAELRTHANAWTILAFATWVFVLFSALHTRVRKIPRT